MFIAIASIVLFIIIALAAFVALAGTGNPQAKNTAWGVVIATAIYFILMVFLPADKFTAVSAIVSTIMYLVTALFGITGAVTKNAKLTAPLYFLALAMAFVIAMYLIQQGILPETTKPN